MKPHNQYGLLAIRKYAGLCRNKKYKASVRGKELQTYCNDKRYSIMLVFIVLILSGDIESNPGPTQYCPICEGRVLDHHNAILCDGCNNWHHIQCTV